MKKIIILLFILITTKICLSQNEEIENINVFNFIDLTFDIPFASSFYSNDLVIHCRTYYNDEIKDKAQNPYGNIEFYLIYKHGSLALRDTAVKRYPDKLKNNTANYVLIRKIISSKDIIKFSDFDIYMLYIKKDELLKEEALDGTPDPGSIKVKSYYFTKVYPYTEYYYYKKRGEEKFTLYNKIAINNIDEYESFFSKWIEEVAFKSNEDYLKQREKNKK